MQTKHSSVFVLAGILPYDLRRHVQSFETNPLVPLVRVLVRKHFEYSFTERSRTYIVSRARKNMFTYPIDSHVRTYVQMILHEIDLQQGARLETILYYFRSRFLPVRSCYHRPFMKELLSLHDAGREAKWLSWLSGQP